MTLGSRVGVGCLLISLSVSAPAFAQLAVERVNVGPGGAQAIGTSRWPSISSDGRYVVFTSTAENLVVGDTNGLFDVFVHDRQTAKTERVSVGAGGVQATHNNAGGAISADGRFVAFLSAAENLVADDTNLRNDLFVRDRLAATTTRVSVATGGVQVVSTSLWWGSPLISGDGRFVAFETDASDLVANDTNGAIDVFLHDRQNVTTVRVNVAVGGGQSSGASLSGISADGRYVLFESGAADLVPGDTNNFADVFVRDMQTSTTTRVSLGPGGVQRPLGANQALMSADGRFVGFKSVSAFVDSGETDPDFFVHDRQTGLTSAFDLIRLESATTYEDLDWTRMSGDGRFICYSVHRQIPGGFGPHELWILNRLTGKKKLILSSADSAVAVDQYLSCGLNGDGTVLVFASNQKNLVPFDSNGEYDIFVHTLVSTVSVDKTSLHFAAVTSGTTFVSQTTTQAVRLSQDSTVPLTWTATSNQPWLRVSPSSGVGTRTLSVSVMPVTGLPTAGIVTGSITVSVPGAANTLSPITVSLSLIGSGTSTSPFGTVDTPTPNSTGVTGAIPFSGWALDDVEVSSVSLCRAAFGSEVAPLDPNCGGAAEIFVGFGTFVDGARPDVAGVYSAYPQSTRAGWGFMVLTNMLPNQGNGTYSFTARAYDREGWSAVLGTRTLTCANASSKLPFGNIDTPEQGGTVTGASFVNFGWALTPLPKTVPIDGSTILVIVDGSNVGTVSYNHARPDIQAAFPGLNNTNGAVGYRVIDTTRLDDGLHTISWIVSDNQGGFSGMGSRFFTVKNDSATVTAAAASIGAHLDVDTLPLDATPITGRQGWDLDGPYGSFALGANGVTLVRSEEVNRVELHLGTGDYAGYLRTPAGLASLPIGSRINPATNVFTWGAGAGFIGRYDFVFVQSLNGRATSRREVRITLYPKGHGLVGPQVVVDVPRANAAVREPFMIGGWAVDLDATEGTGVTSLHAWAYPASGGAPIFLGATLSDGARPDVVAVHGQQFKNSGFGLIVQSLPAGDYDLALFAWSTEKMGFVAPKMVRVTVQP